MIGLNGSDNLGWAAIHRIPGLLVALWLIVALLFSSGIADVVIAADFWLTGGTHTKSIVGLAAMSAFVGVILAAACLLGENRIANAVPMLQQGQLMRRHWRRYGHCWKTRNFSLILILT